MPSSGVWTSHSIYNSSVLPVVEIPLPLGESTSKEFHSRMIKNSKMSNNQPEKHSARKMELASSGTRSLYSSRWTNSETVRPTGLPLHSTPQSIIEANETEENPGVIGDDDIPTQEALRTTPRHNIPVSKPPIRIVGAYKLIDGVRQPIRSSLPPAT